MDSWTSIFLLNLLFLLLFPSSAWAGPSVVDNQRLGIKIQLSAPTSEFSGTDASFLLTVTNEKRPRTLTLEANAISTYMTQETSSTTTRLVQTIPVGTSQLEVPVLRRSESDTISLRYDIDGRRAPKLTTSLTVGHGAREGAVVVIGDSGIDLYAATGVRIASILPVTTLPPSEASRYWQTYLGLHGLVVLPTESAGKLSPAQRTALSRWVKYGGGNLMLCGPGSHQVARDLDMPVPEDILVAGFLTGNLFLTEGAGSPEMVQAFHRLEDRTNPLDTALLKAFELPDGPFAAADRELPLFWGSPPDISASDGTDYFLDLHTVPRFGFGVLSISIALLIGPVNYFLLHRKRRLALFFVTAPALALAGLVVLALYAFLSQGIGVKINEKVLLLHDLDTDEGAVYHLRGMYAGLAPSDVTFSSDTAVLPLVDETYQTESGARVTDWSTGQKLESGWIPSREYSGLATITPLHVRMDVRVETDPSGEVWVDNRLTSSITDVVARLDDPETGGKMFFEASDVAPGQRKKMKRNDSSANVLQLTGQVLLETSALDWRILALAEGLPHIEEGGISGNVVTGAYAYLAVRPLFRGYEDDE